MQQNNYLIGAMRDALRVNIIILIIKTYLMGEMVKNLFKYFIIGRSVWELACTNHAASKESSYVCT